METVGDKYMTVSGLPEPCIHHARSICHLALDMMEIAGQVQVDGESVQVSKYNKYLQIIFKDGYLHSKDWNIEKNPLYYIFFHRDGKSLPLSEIT